MPADQSVSDDRDTGSAERSGEGSFGAAAVSFFRRLFWVPTSPVNLAVLRIVVFGTIAYMAVISRASSFGRLPDVFLEPPDILGEVLAKLPHSSTVVSAATWALLAACALAIVGWKTRWATIVAVVLAVYVLGVPQMYGKVDHYQHLVLIGILLATSPCGDALSIDSWRTPRPARSVAYGFPIRVTWLLIGLCYFFPGLAKLADADVWVTTANMRGLINNQQWAAGSGWFVPDRLLAPAAVATIVFELGFVFAIFNRRLRPFALVGAIVFHVSTWLVLVILFWQLWICFVAFIDWVPGDQRTEERSPGRINVAAAAVVVAGTLITGFTFNQDAWPMACYPTFAYDARGPAVGTTVEVLAIKAGTTRPVELWSGIPRGRETFLVYNALDHPRALANLGRRAAPDAERIQVWQVAESAERANRGKVLGRIMLLDRETRPKRG